MRRPSVDLGGIEPTRAGAFITGRSIKGARYRVFWPCRDGYINFIFYGGAAGRRTNEQLVAWMRERGAELGALATIDWQSWDPTKADQREVDAIEAPVMQFFANLTKREFLDRRPSARDARLSRFHGGRHRQRSAARSARTSSRRSPAPKNNFAAASPSSTARGRRCGTPRASRSPSAGGRRRRNRQSGAGARECKRDRGRAGARRGQGARVRRLCRRSAYRQDAGQLRRQASCT